MISYERSGMHAVLACEMRLSNSRKSLKVTLINTGLIYERRAAVKKLNELVYFWCVGIMSDSESTTSSGSRSSAASRSDALTVESLLEFLNQLVAKNPKAKKMTIHYEEFGSLQKATYITIEDELNWKKVKPYLVIQ